MISSNSLFSLQPLMSFIVQMSACTLSLLYFMYLLYLQPLNQGRIQDFSKGGSQGNGYMYKLYYIHIAIIHIIILNEVHCNLLKAIDA